MNAVRGTFISSFIVAYGHLEASPRGHDEFHIVLADRLTGRLSQRVGVGDYASGCILAHGGRCIARVNRLPRGVARDELLRLVRDNFGDLGDVTLEIQEARMVGEIDQTWPWQWRPGFDGTAVLVESDGASPRVFSWSWDDEGAPRSHSDARTLLAVDRSVDLLIDSTGGCTVYSDVPGLAELLPKLDPRLRLLSSFDEVTWDFEQYADTISEGRNRSLDSGSSRSGTTRAYVAMKFAPSRCPACEQRFDSPQSFTLWAGNQGVSFVEARSLQLGLYPELYPAREEPGMDRAWTSPHRADFIGCTRCGNKTLRIAIDERTVGTREEAEQLVGEAQYICVVECELLGLSLEDRQKAEQRMREQGSA